MQCCISFDKLFLHTCNFVLHGLQLIDSSSQFNDGMQSRHPSFMQFHMTLFHNLHNIVPFAFDASSVAMQSGLHIAFRNCLFTERNIFGKAKADSQRNDA